MRTYTIKELSDIMKVSKKSTFRYLKYFQIPFEKNQRFTSRIKEKDLQQHPELYASIQLTLNKKIIKPFYTIRDLTKIFSKSHSGIYRWLIRNELPVLKCNHKTILLASSLLVHQNKQ